jgi:hypothetical protein
MRVQTAPHGDQHRAMPVHLSTNLQEGGATVRPGLSGSSPKDVMDTAGDHVPPNTEAKFTATSDAGPVRTIQDPSVSETVSRSDAQATSPDLPAWAVGLRTAANIDPYLATPGGCLPADVIAKLREASAKGMDDRLAEVARKLSALRALGLDDDHIRDLVIATRDYLLEGWAEKRVSKGKLTEDEADCIGLAPMPLGAFVRNLASALAKRVEWAKRDIALGKLIPGSRLDRREPRASSARDRELAALADKPMWGVTGTNATNADLVDLCDEFPTMRPNRVRQLLIDAFATLADSNRDAVALSDVLDDTREAIRRELDQQRAGEAMVGDQAQPHNGSSANDRVDPSPDHQAPLNGCGHHP